MHDGRRVVLGGDDFDHHAFDEVSAGHLDVEAVAAVLHAGFQHLHGRQNAMGGKFELDKTKATDHSCLIVERN